MIEMSSLPSAKEAKDLTNDLKENGLSENMQKVNYKITKAINSGEFYCFIDFYILPGNQKKLKDLGYKIINSDSLAIQKDNFYHTIRWD